MSGGGCGRPAVGSFVARSSGRMSAHIASAVRSCVRAESKLARAAAASSGARPVPLARGPRRRTALNHRPAAAMGEPGACAGGCALPARRLVCVVPATAVATCPAQPCKARVSPSRRSLTLRMLGPLRACRAQSSSLSMTPSGLGPASGITNGNAAVTRSRSNPIADSVLSARWSSAWKRFHFMGDSCTVEGTGSVAAQKSASTG